MEVGEQKQKQEQTHNGLSTLWCKQTLSESSRGPTENTAFEKKVRVHLFEAQDYCSTDATKLIYLY